jgi:hypothetical protein
MVISSMHGLSGYDPLALLFRGLPLPPPAQPGAAGLRAAGSVSEDAYVPAHCGCGPAPALVDPLVLLQNLLLAAALAQLMRRQDGPARRHEPALGGGDSWSSVQETSWSPRASGQKLAASAEQIASARDTVGRCYAGVADALEQALGVQVTGASAYMAADQLAASSRFEEIRVSRDQLAKLPAGAVVVWGKTDASPHGHISVALGDGREASDHVSSQLTSLRGAENYRVFMPV